MKILSIKPARASPSERKMRILVVEDEFLIRLLICEELRASSYDVIEAVDADEAVALLKSGSKVDLIMTDVRMPGSIDGLGLIAWVRKTHAKLPILITSGHMPHDSTFDESTEFLPKPYMILEAVRIIEKQLKTVQ